MDGKRLFARAVENWPAKIISIGLAIILFVFHRMNTLEQRFFFVPLAVEHLNALIPSAPYPRMIRVSIKNEAGNTYPIFEDDIEVYVETGKFTMPGTYIVPVQWRKKGGARGAEPLQITVDPLEVTLSLDYRVSKIVPITANLRGQVDPGYAMTSHSLNPDRLVIDGPASLMGTISELYTEFIDLNGRRESFSIPVGVQRQDPLVVLRGNPASEFQGTINRIIPVRNVLNVPIRVTGLADIFTGEPETCSIRLEGETQDEVDRFNPSPGFLSVDCSGIKEPGTYVLNIVTGEAGNLRVRTEPEAVRVRIRYAGEEQR